MQKNEKDFHKSKKELDGLQPYCKECKREYQSVNNYKYVENRYVSKEKKRIYRQRYNEKNKEKNEIYRQMYKEKNKEKNKLYMKKYFQTEKGKACQKNKDHKRRCIKKQGSISSDQLLQLEQDAKICYWCNEPLKNKKVHTDHYIPLSRGGCHTLENLVVSCSKCNQKKHAKDPIEFANSIGKLL